MFSRHRDKAGGRRGPKLIFRTLSSRNYRLFFAGQGISLIGTWMQRVALSWLVYRLTSSEFLLGLVGFLGLFPVFVLSPFAGVLADRFNRHRLLMATQVLAMLQALILALLVLTGRITIGQIMFLASFLGLINAFDVPVRQAFTVEMIERKEDLGNAITLNSAMFNGARLVGPSLAGLLIAVLGEGLCFLINALSYLAVIAALALMELKPAAAQRKRQKMLQGLAEGFGYSFGFAPIRAVLGLLVLASVAGMPYVVLMPVFAKDVLHGGAHTLGFLMGATGGGALIGAFYLASRPTVAGLEGLIPRVAGLFGLGLIGFALSPQQWLALPLILVVGFGMMVQLASSNTLLQTIVDDDKRGRVMSFYAMCFMGTSPFGSLLAGILADHWGAPNTVLLGGACCLMGALLFARKLPELRAAIRPLYVKKGIIPEASPGLDAAG